jgi:hypothetical protein
VRNFERSNNRSFGSLVGGDQFVTAEDSNGNHQFFAGHLEQAIEGLLNEPAIVARLARTTSRKLHDS